MSFKHRLFRVNGIILIRLKECMDVRMLFNKSGVSMCEIYKAKKLLVDEGIIYLSNKYSANIHLTNKGKELQRILKNIYEVL